MPDCSASRGKNSSTREELREMNDEARWQFFVGLSMCAWAVCIVTAVVMCIRTNKKWKAFARGRGAHRKPPPRIQLKKAVYVLVSLTGMLNIAWLQDPKSWNGLYSPNVRNALLNASRVTSLVAWLLIVLFWQESYKLAKDFTQMKGMAYWSRIVRNLAVAAVCVFVPLLVVSSLCLLSNNILVNVYSAVFLLYGVGLTAAALLNVVRLTRHLTAMDRASKSGATWYAFVLQIRCTMTWAVGVYLVQVFCGLWFATSILDASSYVTHAFLTGFSDVVLSTLALLAVFSPTPRSTLKSGTDGAGGTGVAGGTDAQLGGALGALLPRTWLEHMGCCCCAKGGRALRARTVSAVKQGRAMSRAIPDVNMASRSSVQNPVTAGVDGVEMADGSRSSELVLRESCGVEVQTFASPGGAGGELTDSA